MEPPFRVTKSSHSCGSDASIHLNPASDKTAAPAEKALSTDYNSVSSELEEKAPISWLGCRSNQRGSRSGSPVQAQVSNLEQPIRISLHLNTWPSAMRPRLEGPGNHSILSPLEKRDLETDWKPGRLPEFERGDRDSAYASDRESSAPRRKRWN